MGPGDVFAVPPGPRQLGGRRRALRLAALPGRRFLRRGLTAEPSGPSGKLRGCGGQGQNRGDRPAQHPLRRGRSDPASLQLHAGADRGDREGGAQAALAVRRAPGAVLPPRPHPPRGTGRADDRDRGAHDRRASEPARRRPGARGGRARAATRSCASAMRRRPTRRPTTCSAATCRSSMGRSRFRATAAPTGRRGCRPRSPSGSSSRLRPASRPSSPPARAAARPASWSGSPVPPAGWSAPPASATASRSPARRTGSWSRRSAVRSCRRRTRGTAPCARRSARSPRRWNITPTCSYAPRPERRIAVAGASPLGHDVLRRGPTIGTTRRSARIG